jgi:hypothetical protein
MKRIWFPLRAATTARDIFRDRDRSTQDGGGDVSKPELFIHLDLKDPTYIGVLGKSANINFLNNLTKIDGSIDIPRIHICRPDEMFSPSISRVG